MKFRPVSLSLARSLVALSVSLAVILATHTFAFSSFASSHQPDSPQSDFRITGANATATPAGVLIQWHTNLAADNLGFNVYRLKDGQRARVNREIIPGAVFASSAPTFPGDGYSYHWLDRGGTANSTYYVESVSLQGIAKMHEALNPVASKTVSGFEQTAETLSAASASASESSDSFAKNYPAAEDQINSPVGALEDQWAIAAQSGLKIGIKRDGWYRVTKAQMAAAGFNPTVEIRNLRLFVEAQEVAINTSQQTGPFGGSDYIEFFGRGLDTPTTDTRTYYLIAGTVPGKRVRGENQLNDSPPLPPAPIATPTPPISSPPLTSPPPLTSSTPTMPRPAGPALQDPIFYSPIQRDLYALIDSLRPTSTPASGSPRADGNTEAGNAPPDPIQTYKPQPGDFQPDISQPRAEQPVAPEVKRKEQSAGAVGRTRQNTFANAAPGIVIKTAPRVGTRSLRLPVLTGSGHARKRAVAKARKRNKLRREVKPERHHLDLNPNFTPASFDYTAERKDRTVYYSSLRNGDTENFFGQVVNADPSSPTKSQTITTPNPDLTASGPARLEIAMQGVNLVDHQVNLKFNGVSLGSIPQPSQLFFGQSYVVTTFDVPVSLLQNVNTLTFTPPSCTPPVKCPDTTFVDYTRLTYRHQFRYDKAVGNIHLVRQPDNGDTLVVGNNTYTLKLSPTTSLHIGIGVDKQATATNIANRVNTDTAATLCTAVAYPTDVALTANTGGIAGSNFFALSVDGVSLTKTLVADLGVKFSLRGTQSVTVDGFALPSVRLIDYTDPLAVSISRPASTQTGLGYGITVPMSDPPNKTPRLFYAILDGQFDQPASLTLNQPSSLNLNSNAADFLIISYKDFIPNVEPLRLARANQGMTAKVVDVEDVYDEFSYGMHGPQAIKDFLHYAATHWSNGNSPPRYIVFVGDASYDARDYANFGQYDFVPTKLIDDSYTETVSDDWLADFDDDGTADIPVGRIPVRTTAEADLVVSKIINYSPASVPQTAILVADDPIGGFDFEDGNDNVQALLPPSMTVQRVNVRTVGAAQATIDIRNGINQGRAILNYSGHGNIDVWGTQTMWASANATALTNGMSQLTFVVVMDCLNGYFQDPGLMSLSEAFLKAPGGGAVAAFASSGKTTTPGQRQMELELYRQLYGPQPIAVGDAIKIAKAASSDIDVRTTWVFFGDPSIKIR